MASGRTYPPELRDRAQRMVVEARDIGKESNELEEQAAGESTPSDDPLTEYTDPDAIRVETRELFIALHDLGWATIRIAKALGVDRKTIQRLPIWRVATDARAARSVQANRQSGNRLNSYWTDICHHPAVLDSFGTKS